MLFKDTLMWTLVLKMFSFSVISDSATPWSAWNRLPCPSPTPRACLNLCPLGQWCHPTISSSVVPFSSCLQYFSASGSFLISRLFTSGGQSIGASTSASILPVNIQDWFPLGLTRLISLQSKRLSRVFSKHHSLKASVLWRSAFMVRLSHPYMTTGKTIVLTTWTSVSKVVSLLFNMLSRSVIAFPFKELASFNFMAAVTVHGDFGAQENKVCHCFHYFPIYLLWSDGTECCDLCFLNVEF